MTNPNSYRRPLPMLERFWAKVDKNGAGGCWLWTGAMEGKGYGHFRDGRKDYRAHHLSWEQVNGPRPKGMNMLHRCDVRNCVNPAHLFLGTQAENMKDAQRKGRTACRKLTDDQVREIRKELSAGVMQKDLAPRYGVSRTVIYKINGGFSYVEVK